MFSGIFGPSSNPFLGQPETTQGAAAPSSNDIKNQFNDKLQQIKVIIAQLNKKRTEQKNFNNTVKDKLSEFTKQLTSVIIPSVKKLKSQIATLRDKSNTLNNNIEQKQNENVEIIEKVNDEEIKKLLEEIEDLKSKQQQLLYNEESRESYNQQIIEKLQNTEKLLQEAKKEAEEKTQQQVYQIQQNNSEIDSLKQQKAQLEQLITNSMTIMDEIIADLNGLNAADNNDELNSSIDAVKQNIDELTQLLSGVNVNQSQANTPKTETESNESTLSFGISPTKIVNSPDPVPKQKDSMVIRYPIWINSSLGGLVQSDYLSIDSVKITLGQIINSLSNCSFQVCNDAVIKIASIMKPTEAQIIQILLENMISITYDNSGFISSQGNDETMKEIRNLVSQKNISSGGKKIKSMKKRNKKTRKNNKKTKKQRGGWNYYNKRNKRTKRTSRTSKRKTPTSQL